MATSYKLCEYAPLFVFPLTIAVDLLSKTHNFYLLLYSCMNGMQEVLQSEFTFTCKWIKIQV